MLSPIESSIRFLEETNDPHSAYFSFTADPSGEQGAIKANKEGLRLYAALLLKKSLEMEQERKDEPLYFDPQEWIISESGYDLISCVEPRFTTRDKILTEKHNDNPVFENKPITPPVLSAAGCFSSVGVVLIICVSTFYAFKWFS